MSDQKKPKAPPIPRQIPPTREVTISCRASETCMGLKATLQELPSASSGKIVRYTCLSCNKVWQLNY